MKGHYERAAFDNKICANSDSSSGGNYLCEQSMGLGRNLPEYGSRL